MNKLPSINELVPWTQLYASNELLKPVQIDSVDYGSGWGSKFSVISYRSSYKSNEKNSLSDSNPSKTPSLPQCFHAVIKNHLIQTKLSLQENKQVPKTESKSLRKPK